MKEKNFDLIPRRENTREKYGTEVIRFELEEIRQHFEETLTAINAQFEVANTLIKEEKADNAATIWRAQIVFLASALDFYMHELTKYGLCEIFDHNWEKTEKFDHIQVDMKIIQTALENGEETDWFLDYINNYYRVVTMVSFESIKGQLNLLGIDLGKVADNAFYQRDCTEKTKDKLKRRLDELFRRRNFIAHQADRAHEDAQLETISEKTVKEFMQDVQKIINAIHKEAFQKHS